ncbi:hypothetical protein C0Q70_00054 [Pomacea canaliculata]|uniref:Tr-type G domain-containing protein n=1 Tax=Pomacea canaliculata TaxID=400727 RepID=A0A2T7PVL2_POMCA|nr:hypothetical protein C0Q70_00054 [Pomacea canaliculata]
MAGMMEFNELDSPMIENGGGLFGPDDDDEDVVSPMGKMVLVSPSSEEFEFLVETIKTRVLDAQGETIYEIGTGEGEKAGLKPDDYQASVATLHSISSSLGLECVLLRERTAQEGTVAEYLLRQKLEPHDFMEVRVAVVGNVDAGKSTLLGVLTHGELDNGRGFARQKLFRHKHEIESVCIGFPQVKNEVVTFIDLAGHERYLKTTVFGMTGHAPDFAMLMIGANAGVIGMTKEHLGLALALNVPVFVVVTKVDMCPPNVMAETLKLLTRILKSPGCRKIPVIVQNKDDVICSATNFTSERMCPVFQVSNVTGENLDLLKMFLNLLSTRVKCDISKPAEFQIDDTFSVPGVGTVVSGTLLQGFIRLNDTLLLGPDALGQFQSIVIKSIHRKRMPVKEVRGGQTASFALKKIKRSTIRKGMVMVSPRLEPKACWEFEGEILVLHHPTTISVRYQAMVHVGSVRQTATILQMTEPHLRTGDKAMVRFRFIKNPEYLKMGMRLVFREGRTKAVGTITNLFPHVSAVAQNTRQQRATKKAQQETKHPLNPQNEPQKPSKRNRRSQKSASDYDAYKENVLQPVSMPNGTTPSTVAPPQPPTSLNISHSFSAGAPPGSSITPPTSSSKS